MINVKEAIAAVLAYCNYPTEDSLTTAKLLRALWGRLDYYRVKLDRVNKGWSLASTLLTLEPQRADYTMSVENFSKPVLVETFYPNRPEARGQILDTVEVQELSLYRDGRRRAIAFWGFDSEQIKAEVAPVPAEQVELRIWYQPGKVQDPSFENPLPLFAQFHDLVCIHTAMLCVTDCAWFMPGSLMLMGAVETAQKQAALSATLQAEFMRYHKEFEEWIVVSKPERPAVRPAFNQWRYYD